MTLLCVAPEARAQARDSAGVAPRVARVDTVTRAAPLPPLSPRRAFLYSLAVPGFGQSRLGRPIAGAVFVLTESIAIAMLRESRAELGEARLFRQDTLVNIGNDPATGAPVLQRTSYNDELISIRRGHVEDWIAFLIANHLFAGADAYVAAHLWDLPTQVSVIPTSYGPALVARIRW
ncbi:MAG: hypothetical protein M3Z05_14640 [Gemmatimonadota bacterium]|nr:hypothetical protein [Gemmatimonadota bacterium]